MRAIPAQALRGCVLAHSLRDRSYLYRKDGSFRKYLIEILIRDSLLHAYAMTT